MGFFAPLFLLGAIAVALPFWLHRLQTQSSLRQPFSSTMLLETTEQQVHVQKKLKYLVLLSLRVAVLLILALVFAKPFLPRPAAAPASGQEGTYLVLIDTSASMSRDGVFDRAVTAAYGAIESVPAGALIQVLDADDDVSRVSELSADKSMHRSAVSALGVSALRLDFGRMMTTIDRLAESLPPPVRLHVISDFQDSAMPARFADLVSSQVAEMIPHSVGMPPRFNRRIEYVRDNFDEVDIGIEAGTGAGATGARIELLLNDEAIDARVLSETGRATLQFSGLRPDVGDNRLTVRLDNDDDLAFDDQWFHVIENVPPAPIPLITLNDRGLPVKYLSAALESDAAYRVEPMLIGDADFRTLSRYRWAIVDDLASLDGEQAAALATFVQQGGSLFAFVGERAAGAERLPISGHVVRPTGIGAGPYEFITVGQLDSRHPVLSRTEGWFNVNIRRNIAIDPLAGDQVLMRLENDVPLLIERRLGKGRLLVLTAGLDNRWNDLPIRPVFVGFIIEAARYLSGVDRVTKSFTAGDTLTLSLVEGASGQVLDPEGNAVLSLAGTTRAQQIKLNKPGYYEVYTPQEDYIVAVNTDPRESDLNTIATVTLERWVRATGGQAPTDGRVTSDFDPEPLELWHALIVLLALLVIGESMLGNANLTPLRKTLSSSH